MLTNLQLMILEELTDRYPVVLADELSNGTVIFTPAEFCGSCGGDGIDPGSYEKSEFEDCSPCRGKGGVPLILPPVLVPRFSREHLL